MPRSQNGLTRNYSEIPIYQTATHQMQVHDLSAALTELKAHYSNILSTVDASLSPSSPVLEACRLSLLTRAPLVVSQAENLIESLEHCTDVSSRLKDKLQASCTILRAAKYLDTIELAMKNPPRDCLDDKLLKMLQCEEAQLLRQEVGDGLQFRISPWLPSCLAFDLPVGKSVHQSFAGDRVSPPLNVEVEPVFEFHANDLINDRNVIGSFQACRVEVEKVRHKALDFTSGSGTVGECMICVRVSPLSRNSQMVPIWGEEPEVDQLVIKEARA
jgi:hypothetical protein